MNKTSGVLVFLNNCDDQTEMISVDVTHSLISYIEVIMSCSNALVIGLVIVRNNQISPPNQVNLCFIL